ncbi:hypothetical protein AX16_009123 [Volvariella volvacea WC 439]|nr:hypothetical protein AX16_009123 [Volvariella volvacea WC 439]
MASHYTPQHQRHSLHSSSVNNDLRLPSLKSLNFQYRNPHQEVPPSHSTSSTLEPHVLSSQDHAPRHVQSWGRSSQSSTLGLQPQHYQPPSHQQHTPPLSAGHEVSKSAYSPKHDSVPHVNPLSAQATPVLGSAALNQTGRSDEPSAKRTRTSSQTLSSSRDVRPVHAPYPQQYTSYAPSQAPPPASPFHPASQAATGSSSAHTSQPPHQQHTSSHASQQHPAHPPPTPSPFPHEHVHHPAPTPAPAHTPYPHYQQQQYVAPRSSMHPPPQPQQVHQSNQPHGNPYPSPGPPSAPPPQGPWESSNTVTASSHHIQQQQHAAPPSTPQHVPQTAHHMQHQTSPAMSHASMQQDTPQLHHQPAPTPVQHHTRPPLHTYQHQPAQQPQAPPTPAPPPTSFTRTTTLIPTPLETRPSYHAPEPERIPVRDANLAEITRLCQTLHGFAARFGHPTTGQPSSNELVEMTRTAHHVVRLVDDYRRAHIPESERNKMDTSEDHRPPKRPWEDMAGPSAEGSNFQEQYPGAMDKSTAEMDMEIIRQKRASSTAAGAGSSGQPKSKYRKRSRATPPGKCHSCNIRETPEWRRGPDGARTLCNACGLHYAKLMRKRDRNANGELPKIDLETLRASARAADNKSQSRQHQQTIIHHSQDASNPPMDPKHGSQHSFVVAMVQDTPPAAPPPPPPESNRVHQPSAPPPQHHPMATSSIPPQPTSHWGSAPASRTYSAHEPIQQSFIRNSQHAPPVQASSRQ